MENVNKDNNIKASQKSKEENINISKEDKKTLKKKTLKVFKIIFLNLIALAMVLTLLFFIANVFIYNYSDIEISDSTFYQLENETNIYDKDGNLLESISEIDSNPLEFENISPYFFEALISSEDTNFTKHNGVSYIQMLKAIIRTLSSDSSYGGSTITMQLAKNLYMQDWMVYNDEGISRHDTEPIKYKITQMSIAMQIEDNYPKEDIITQYANVVFFGYGGYGISNASENYFNKEPKDLTLRESAYLASIPNNPYGLNPYEKDSLQMLNSRCDATLYNMFENGYITEEELNSALKEEVNFKEIKSNVVNVEYIDYYDIVLKEVYNIVPDINLATADLDIYTGLDKKKQNVINKEIKDKSYKQENIEQGIIAVNPDNGLIQAIGSGTEDEDVILGVNLATDNPRQPGSTIKPVLDYAPAMEYLNWDSNTIVNDITTYYSGGGTEVHNSTGDHFGNITVKYALQTSRNTTALQAFQQVAQTNGYDWYRNYMKDLGFSDYKGVNEAYSIGGFNIGTTPLEMAGAYQMFANDGYYYHPHAIFKIIVKNNSPFYKVPEDYANEDNKYWNIQIKDTTEENEDFTFSMTLVPDVKKKKIISEKTASEITKCLDASSNSAYSHIAWTDIGKTLAIKTGTTDWGGDNSDEIRDTWTIGYTDDTVLAIWNGFLYEDEQKGERVDDLAYDDEETFKAIFSNKNFI